MKPPCSELPPPPCPSDDAACQATIFLPTGTKGALGWVAAPISYFDGKAAHPPKMLETGMMPKLAKAAFTIHFHGRASRPLVPPPWSPGPPRKSPDPSLPTPSAIPWTSTSMVVRGAPSAGVAHPALSLAGINRCLGCVSRMHSIVENGHTPSLKMASVDLVMQ
jgi:hypothetical protein